VKLGKNANDTCAKLSEAYGREAIKILSFLVWHEKFKVGREIVEDDESDDCQRSYRTGENVGKVRYLVHSDRPNSQQSLLCGNIEVIT
jgi:hypothetical protein